MSVQLVQGRRMLHENRCCEAAIVVTPRIALSKQEDLTVKRVAEHRESGMRALAPASPTFLGV